MDRMDDFEAFLAIVESGSQTAAARRLGRSLQSINRSLGVLERSIGVQLIRRTTRRSSLTEAGLAFYRRVKPAFTEIDDAKREAANTRTQPSGVVRIGAPVLFAPTYVAPAICEFMTRYPQVEVELKVSDRPTNLVEAGLDLAVRIRQLPDSGMKARRLGELRLVVFGAPSYFAAYGRPTHPADLGRHHCVVRLGNGEAETWPFMIGGRRKSIRINGRFRTDSTAAAHVAVAQGLGLGFGPLWQIRDLVDRGAVELVLTDYEAAKIPVYAVWPPTKVPSATLRKFTDLLAGRLKREYL